jgi:hypothetical protein
METASWEQNTPKTSWGVNCSQDEVRKHAPRNWDLRTLCGYRVAFIETCLLTENFIQLVNLGAVVVEDLHEGGLCSCCTLCSAESKFSSDFLDVFKIHHQILNPLGGATADGDALSRLVMSAQQISTVKSQCGVRELRASESPCSQGTRQRNHAGSRNSSKAAPSSHRRKKKE